MERIVAQHRPGADPRPVDAARAFVHLPLRQPGRAEGRAALGRPHPDLRAAGHGARHGFLGVPARGDDPARLARAGRRALVRSRRCPRHVGMAPFPDRDAPGRQVRPHLGDDGRVHDGDRRVRRAQDHRRALPGPCGRRVQAGDRAAELPHGRGGWLDPPSARGRCVRGRLSGAAEAAGAAHHAQRAVCAAPVAGTGSCVPRARDPRFDRHARRDRHGGVRLVREVLALQPFAHDAALHVRLRGGRARARIPQQPRHGVLVRGARRGDHVRRRVLDREDARRRTLSNR